MVKGLFTSSEGMIPLMAKQDQIAHNLANINTTGYKKSRLMVKAFSEFLRNDQREPFVNDRIVMDEVRIDWEPGAYKQTDNPLDVAIEGGAFFLVDTVRGQRFTRNGSFSIDRKGYLVTSEGHRIIGRTKQGKEKHIQVKGKHVSILADGAIHVDGESVGVLRMVTFNRPFPLDREGNSLFKLHKPDAPIFEAKEFELHQGFVETSNADPVESMVEMIATFRNYEANQKAIWAQNETLGKAVNEVGRIG